MSVLAIDAGTTGVTTVVVGPTGQILATAHQDLAQHSPGPGWVEHAPEEVWQATLAATRDVLREVDANELTSVGVTNQRETIVLWDRETLGSPRRAIAGQDRRTTDICTRLHDAGHEERVSELTGLRLDPSFSGTTLTWLAEHEPHTWALVTAGRYAVGTVDSYLVARMTRGTWHVTDVSNASRTLLFDLEEGDWSDELCQLFGVPPDALPELVPSWGEVASTDASAFLGLSLPIAGLAGDQQSVLFAQTCFDAGDSSCTWATSPTILTNTGSTLVRPGAGLLSTAAWRSPDGVLTYATEGSVLDTGAAARAMWGATTFDVRDVPESMPEITSLRVGGAAADDALCQLLADQVGLRVERSTVVETAALGAAFLAGLGTGVWGSTDALRETWSPDRAFEPGADRADTVERSTGSAT